MYGQTPSALIAAREDEALTHGQVLYGLVKPTKDMKMIESTAAMVNVIPKKRIYRMERREDIDLFMSELMKRPLVIQPSAHIGRGLAAIGCALYTREERWIVMVNQSHPKIRSRIQTGIDIAKKLMEQGEPFVLELSFNSFLKRVYLDRLTKAALNKRFTFIEFEDAEIVIRYPGEPYMRKSGWTSGKGNDMKFVFEDLLPGEIVRRTVSDAQAEWKSPALRVIMPDELQSLLRGWDFENRDPMDGVEIPEDEDEEEKEHLAIGGAAAEEETQFMDPQGGKIVGRSRRKAQQQTQNLNPNQTARKYEVPVELHVPKPQQVLQRMGPSGGYSANRPDASPQQPYPPSPHSPNSPTRRGDMSPARLSPSGPYENLDRRPNGGEHAYEQTRYGHNQGSPPRSPNYPSSPSPYEDVRAGASAYRAQNSAYSPGHSSKPATPNSTAPQDFSMPKTPRTPVSPRNQQRSPAAPQAVRSDDRYNTSVTSGSAYRNDDRYNTEVTNTTRPSQKTYLTDDNDDGGFRSHNAQSPRQQQRFTYDSSANHNKGANPDRNGNPKGNQGAYNPSDRYNIPNPSDRYANQNEQSDYKTGIRNDRSYGSDRSRDNQLQTGQPIPAPRGFHRQQGSGRSDTSASDSGIGEIDYGSDSSRYRTDKYGAYSNGRVQEEIKTPYYNRAFEHDHDHEPVEQDLNGSDIKVAAARLMHKQGLMGAPKYDRTDRYNDPNYTRELQKWRENISGLEHSVGDMNSARSQLQADTVEESFI